MKRTKHDNESMPPWEEAPEAPQKITAAEASAAAAVIPGKGTTPGGANRERRSADAAPGATPETAAGATAGQPSRKAPASKIDRSLERSLGRSRWQPSQMGYRWVVRNVSFLLFLASLAVIYIYNGHYADKISRDLNRTNKELKELQYEYKTLKSEVMFRSKESELARAVEPFGLKELTSPPFVLIDSTQK
jgi:Bacteriodetes cell division protein (FtsL-like)